MRMCLRLAAVLLLAACGEDRTPDTQFAPTGAKGATDEFGDRIFLDEECGGRSSSDYAQYFQNALFRDGDVNAGRMWLVDGTHLWSATVAASADTVVRLELPFAGHANAVAAAPGYLALALVDGGVAVFPAYDLKNPVYLAHANAIDVDHNIDRLAVAAGDEGVLIYDLSEPDRPVLIETIDAQGFAAGARWDKDGTLYFAACNRAGYVTFAGGAAEVFLTGELSHANAKDAHGGGGRMVVANNGGGVWFWEMSDMARRSALYEVPGDPNFYTNAAFVEGENAYVAAGNRELLALWIHGDYQPRFRQRRDPLGIDVDGGVVYGYGNFRDIGERTVVRAPVLTDSWRSGEAFESGLEPWVEPQHYALWSSAATEQILTRIEGNSYVVYRAPLAGSTWKRDPAHRFLYHTAGYALAVTEDNVLRLTAPGALTSEVIFSWGLWDRKSYITDVGTGKSGPTLVFQLQDGKVFEWPLQEQFPYAAYEPPREDLCKLQSYQDEGGYTRFVNQGAYGMPGTSGVTLRWCSRTVDPYTYGNRPPQDLGGILYLCDRLNCMVALRDSGVIGALALGEGKVALLIDDRIGYSAQIIVGDLSRQDYEAPVPSEVDEEQVFTFDTTIQERRRYATLGRPEGWRLLDDGRIRVWLTDGSAFTFDPHEGSAGDDIGPAAEVTP